MKAQLPRPEHYSYKLHRRQAVTQVILPVVLAGLLLIAAVIWISVATFGQGADITRWAAVSTMWIFIPILVAGLIFLVILAAFIYLLAQLLGILPTYTGIAQDYVYKIQARIIHLAGMVVRPVIAFNGFIARLKAFFGRD